MNIVEHSPQILAREEKATTTTTRQQGESPPPHTHTSLTLASVHKPARQTNT